MLAEKVVPEFLQEYGTVEAVSAALAAVIADGPERRRQLDAFARLDRLMDFAGEEPSTRAARVVLDTVKARRGV